MWTSKFNDSKDKRGQETTKSVTFLYVLVSS